MGIEKKVNSTPNSSFWQQGLIDSLRITFVFCFVSTGWLLFKLPHFSNALDFIITLFRNVNIKPGLSYIVPVMIFSLPVILYHLPHFPPMQRTIQIHGDLYSTQPWRKLCSDLIFGIMLVLLFLNSGSANEFIYFQF